MIKNKKSGFTLSEALITLTIVGVVAILVVPGLVKDMTDKSRMALLQSTISGIDTAIQTEITRTGAKDLKYTKLATPEEFLKLLDTSKVTADALSFEHYGSSSSTIDGIKSLNGIGYSAYISEGIPMASAKLKNGATVLLTANGGGTDLTLYIDVNGKADPNIIGIDFFNNIKIANKTTVPTAGPFAGQYTGVHIGDIGNCINSIDLSADNCKAGNNCYCLLEQSGFDPHYLD